MKGLEIFKEALARETFGMTLSEALAQGVCIDCKRPPQFYSEAGRREYRISGLCERCFDGITQKE